MDKNVHCILGTAQLGFPYGVANTTGQPDQAASNALVAEALKLGVRYFDTAQGYGRSEAVLGEALQQCGGSSNARIITKVSPKEEDSPETLVAGVLASMQRLGVSCLYGLLLHSEAGIPLLEGMAGKAFQYFKLEKKVEKTGVSVYTPEAALTALMHPLVDVVQVPASVFDRRFESAGVFAAAETRDKEIHIRSALLQGVLCLAPEKLPCALRPLAPALAAYRATCERHGLAPAVAALLWVRGRYPRCKYLFGAETACQVRENLLRAGTVLSQDARRELDAILPPQEAKLLNPSLWGENATH